MDEQFLKEATMELAKAMVPRKDSDGKIIPTPLSDLARVVLNLAQRRVVRILKTPIEDRGLRIMGNLNYPLEQANIHWMVKKVRDCLG